MHRDAKILLTGGTGFVGSHMTEYLLSQGYTNITLTTLNGSEEVPNATVYQVDLSDADQTFACFEHCKPDYIVNLAAVATVGNSFEKAKAMVSVNAAIMLSVLEAMRKVTPTAKMLQVSSAAVYGISTSEDEVPQSEQHPFRPVNPYAVSKLTQEFLAQTYARSYSLDIVYVRSFNHTGERQTSHFAIPAFAEQIVAIEQGEQNTLLVGNLEAVRDFTDVKDIVRAYQLLLTSGISGEVYNLGSGIGYSMKQVLDMLISFSTTNIRVSQESELLRPLDIPVSIADNEKITALGWRPEITLSDTLQRVLEWQRKQKRTA